MRIDTSGGKVAGNGTSPNMNTSSQSSSGSTNDPFYVPSNTPGGGGGKDPGQGTGKGQGKGDGKGDGNGQGQGQGQGQGKGGEPEIKDKFNFEDIEAGDTIQGTVKFSEGDSRTDAFTVHSTTKDRKIKFDLGQPEGFKNVRFKRLDKDCVLIKTSKTGGAKKKMSPIDKIMIKKQLEERVAADIIARYHAGIKNFWMVGPAGAGKTTIAKMVADALGFDFYLISCSIGTSAAKFEGYKYPTPRGTKFAEYYEKKSIIVVDEFTALDPAVAQALNAALANDQMEITTSTAIDGTDVIKRHADCIMIGTSNTFGTGANPTYNANNQLDASTRDRFTGGIMEVDYSKKYESQFDLGVINFVWAVRDCIKANNLQRIASTRMIIAGCKLKKFGFEDWTAQLLTDWSNKELKLLLHYFKEHKIPVRLAFDTEPAPAQPTKKVEKAAKWAS